MFIKQNTKTFEISSTAASTGISGASGITSLIKSRDSSLLVTAETDSSNFSKPSPLLCRTNVKLVAVKCLRSRVRYLGASETGVLLIDIR